MKKKYLLFLLTTSLIIHCTHAVNNSNFIKDWIEITSEQKEEIVKKIQKIFVENNADFSASGDIGDIDDVFSEIAYENKAMLFFVLKELPPLKKKKLLESVFTLNWLTRLDLSDNELKNLPITITNLFKLKQLLIDKNNFVYFPKTITKLINLQKLNFNYNELISLPDSIEKLINLKDLRLVHNNLKSLPEGIFKLTRLQKLKLGYNKLRSLSKTIDNLNNLQTLYINNNKLTSLPETIGNLVNLNRLDLSNNQLITIPASIKNIPNLNILDLKGNPHLLPRSDNSLEWGKEELRAHFGDRLMLDKHNLKAMPISTTQEKVYTALDKAPLHINRDIFTTNKLPDIKVEKIFGGEEMLQALTQIITSINFKDDTQPGYLSYEMLANDFASDARNDNLSNLDKVWTYLMPRLTGYIRALYNLPLEGNDIKPWKMYEAQIPEAQKALTFIMERIRDTIDPDAKMLLFNLLVNGLLHCPTGQTEGINSVAYALSEGGYQTNNFKDNLKRFLAVKKNANFTTAILAKGADNSQNVHLISEYRDELKEDLGLNAAISSYHERMGILGQDPFSGNKWNVVQVFYDIASPNRLIDWVMQSAETKKDREDEKNLRDIAGQKLSPTEHSKAVNPLRTQIHQNHQFRPFTTGSIAEYLYTQKLITDDESDESWKKYFTADPLMDDFAILTRDGAKAILIHEGFLIEEPKNEKIMSNNDIMTD
jgi:hypothetical protein